VKEALPQVMASFAAPRRGSEEQVDLERRGGECEASVGALALAPVHSLSTLATDVGGGGRVRQAAPGSAFSFGSLGAAGSGFPSLQSVFGANKAVSLFGEGEGAAAASTAPATTKPLVQVRPSRTKPVSFVRRHSKPVELWTITLCSGTLLSGTYPGTGLNNVPLLSPSVGGWFSVSSRHSPRF
jgi:hypothetical protein